MDSGNGNISLEELHLYKNDMLSDSLEVKLIAIKKMSLLAQAIGPEKTRQELIDHLEQNINYFDEDEVLLCLTEQLETFLPLIGGSEFSYILFSILLKITKTDETLVRKRAVVAIKKVIDCVNSDQITEFLYSAVIGGEDMWYPQKCSALALIPVFYPRATTDNKSLLRQKFCSFSEDNSSAIRREVALLLPEFITVLEIEYLLKDFMPVLFSIATDDQDSVRVNAIQVCIDIGKRSYNDEVKDQLLELLMKLSQDKSWKVRQRLALLIVEAQDTFTDQSMCNKMLEIYDNLSEDMESEVRLVSAENIYPFSKTLVAIHKKNLDNTCSFDKFFEDKLLLLLQRFNKDDNHDVRLAFSSNILTFSSIISSDTFRRTIFPIVLSQLQNETSWAYKENILKNLNLIPIDIDLIVELNSIKKVISDILLSSESSWRIRRSILLTIFHISSLCTAEYFNENLLVYYIYLLKDKVYSVRRTSSVILPSLTKRFGPRWLMTELMPYLVLTMKDDKYLHRYIILFCSQELIQPTLQQEGHAEVNYLSNLKNLIESSNEEKYLRKLAKIIGLNTKLEARLKESVLSDIISNYQDENNIEGENVALYGEEVLTTLVKSNTHDWYSIKETEMDDDLSFLEGILVLLHNVLLQVLLLLLKDPIRNIRDRSNFVLTKVKHFSAAINEEISAQWVKDCTERVSEETWSLINKDVLNEIGSVPAKVVDDFTKLNISVTDKCNVEMKLDLEIDQQALAETFVDSAEPKSETIKYEMNPIDES